MTLAGITYASGTPWTGTLLNVKMSQARSHLRTRDAKRTDGDRPRARPGPRRPDAGSPAGIAPIVVPAEARVIGGATEPEPTFALAALAPTEFVMNEAGVDPGLTREQAFARIHKHRVFREVVGRGAVPVWMPRLLVADAIEARRLHFLPTRDGATGPEGKPALGAFDRARLRSWLNAMKAQFAGVRTSRPLSRRPRAPTSRLCCQCA